MRTYWILPNRDQADDIHLSDGETTVLLREILDPKLRPEGFSHGVPTELLEKCGPAFGQILFAQRFGHWRGDGELFSVSAPAGLDSSGRVVHLGLLFVLEAGERPRFDRPYAGLPAVDQPYARALIQRLTSCERGDVWVQSVRELSDLPSGSLPATNVALDRAVVRFHSLYVVGAGGLIAKAVHRRNWHVYATVVLLLFVVAGAWLAVRACRPLPHPATEAGEVTWRSS